MTKSFDEIVSNYNRPSPGWTVTVNGTDYTESLELIEFRDGVNNPIKFTVKLKGVDKGASIPKGAEVVVSKRGGALFRGVLQQANPDTFQKFTLEGAGYSSELEGDVSNNFKDSTVTEVVNNLIDSTTTNTNTPRTFSTSFNLSNTIDVPDFRANTTQLEDVNRLMGEYGTEWYVSYDSNNEPVFNVTDQLQNDDGSGNPIGELKTYGPDQTAEIVSQNTNRNQGNFDGVRIRGYGDGDDQIEVTSGLTGKDNRTLIFTDKTILSETQAQERADELLNSRSETWQEIEVKPNNPNRIYSVGDLLKVDSEEAKLSDNYRVVETYYKIWPGETEFESKLTLSNKPQTFLSDFKTEKAKREGQTDHMQGARNVWGDKEASNATNAEPLTIDFEVPEDVVDIAGNNRLSRIEFNYACTPYRQSGDPQSVTADNFDPNVKVVGTEVEPAGVEMERSDIKDHAHVVGSATSGGASEVQASNGFIFDQPISSSGWTKMSTTGDGSDIVTVDDVDGDLEHELNIEIYQIENESTTVTRDLQFAVLGSDDSPTASFEYNPAFPTAGESVEFVSTSGPGAIASYHWDFNDGGGTTSVGRQVNYAFSKGGDYDVELRIYPNGGSGGEIIESSSTGNFFEHRIFTSITAVDTANNVFSVSGDETSIFSSGDTIVVSKSTGNDGSYTVSSPSYDSASNETDITVQEDVTDSTADGGIASDDYSSSQVRDGDKIVVTDSDGNDGEYTVLSTSVNSNGNTEVEVVEDVDYSYTGSSTGQIEYFLPNAGGKTDTVTNTVSVLSAIQGLSAEQRKKFEVLKENYDTSTALEKASSDVNLSDEDITTQDVFSIIEVDQTNDIFWIDTGLNSNQTDSTYGSLIEVINSSGNDGVYDVVDTFFRNSSSETGLEVSQDIPDSTADGSVEIDYTEESSPDSAIYIDGNKTIDFSGFLFAENNGDVEGVLYRASGSLTETRSLGTQSFSSPGGFESFTISEEFDSDFKDIFLDGTADYTWWADYNRPIGDKWANKSENPTIPGINFKLFNFTPQTKSNSQTINTQSFDFEWNFIPDNVADLNADELNSLEVVRVDPGGTEHRSSVSTSFYAVTADTNTTSTLDSGYSANSYEVSVDSVSSGDSADITLDGGSSSAQTFSVSEEEIISYDGFYFLVERINGGASDSVRVSGEFPFNDSGDYLTEGYVGLSSGDHDFYVEAEVDDGGGTTTIQSNTITVTVELNEPPTADFTFSPSNPDTYESVRFNDESSDPDGNKTIEEWFWEFGDGTTETLNSFPGDTSHSYSTSGTFDVTLTVTDDAGVSDSVTKSVTVGAADTLDETVIMDSQDNVGATPTTINSQQLSGETVIMANKSNVGAQNTPGSGEEYLDVNYPIPGRDMHNQYELYVATTDKGFDTLRGEWDIINKNHTHDVPRQDDFEDKDADVGAGAENKEVPYKRAVESRGDVLLDFGTVDEAITLDTTINGNDVTIKVANSDQVSKDIIAVDTSNNVLTVSGDITSTLEAADAVTIANSTANDGDYTVSSLNYDSTNDETDVTVQEDVTDGTADGTLNATVLNNEEEVSANNGTATTSNTYQDEELYVEISSANNTEEFEIRNQGDTTAYRLAAAAEGRFRSAKTRQQTDIVSGSGSEQEVVEGVSSKLLAGTKANNVKLYIDDSPDDNTDTKQEITGDLYDGASNSGTSKDKELGLGQYVDSPGWYRLIIEPDQASFIKSRVFLDHHKDTE